MHLKSTKRGDTLIEVVLAFAMFALVAVISIGVMNNSISGAEADLELTLARTEIDSQAETLRFIHASFADNMKYPNLWYKIINQKTDSDKLPNLDATRCSDLYDSAEANIYNAKAFIVNPRKIVDGNVDGREDYYRNTLIIATDDNFADVKFQPAVLSPRVIYTRSGSDSDIDGSPATSDDVFSEESDPNRRYTKVSLVEGLYDMVIAGKAEGAPNPPHYDFYVYTCWMPSGADRPTTIGTILRLYNPEYVDQ